MGRRRGSKGVHKSGLVELVCGKQALADLPGYWKLAGGLELCCDQWWLLHNPCGPRPAVLPDLNAGSGASKCSQAVLVVEVLDGCVREVGINCVCIGGKGGGGGEGYTSRVLLSWSVVNMGTAGLRKALADLPCRWKLAGGLELCCDQWWLLHNPCGPRPAVLYT